MPTNSNQHSIADCLVNLGIVNVAFFRSTDISSLDDEFKAIKRLYMKKVLREHPDKGGDANEFRKTQTSFEVLRDLFSHKKVAKGTFASYLETRQKRSNRRRDDDVDDDEEEQPAENWNDIFEGFGSSDVPSYDYFAEAAKEDLPEYRVEPAKSGRSQCNKCKPPREKRPRRKLLGGTVRVSAAAAAITTLTVSAYIPKGALRVGSLDHQTGSYGRWYKLACWPVPHKIWQGLTDPTNAETVWVDLLHMDQIVISGLSVLLEGGNEDHMTALVEHVMNRDHWEPKKKPKTSKKRDADNYGDLIDLTTEAPARKDNAENGDIKRIKASSNNANEDKQQPRAAKSAALVNVFVIPRPGVDGAMNDDYLQGKRFVLTGLFPEVGGGMGLDEGKDRVKALIESFGGRVTGSVSGKTNYLVVGKEPGAKKVGDAMHRNLPMWDLRTLRHLLMGEMSFNQAEAKEVPKIKSFSGGYDARKNSYLTYY